MPDVHYIRGQHGNQTEQQKSRFASTFKTAVKEIRMKESELIQSPYEMGVHQINSNSPNPSLDYQEEDSGMPKCENKQS